MFHTRPLSTLCLLISVTVCSWSDSAALAQLPTTGLRLTAPEGKTEITHAFELSSGVSLSEQGAGGIGYRVQLGEALRIGVDLRWTRLGSRTNASGTEGDAVIVRTPILLKLKSFGRLRIDIALAPGIRHIEYTQASSHTALTLSSGAFLHWRLLSAFSLRAGVSLPLAVTIMPSDNPTLHVGASGHMGMSIRFTDWCWAYADAMVSVIDDGRDRAERVAIEGQFGLRFYFADGADHDIVAPLPTVY